MTIRYVRFDGKLVSERWAVVLNAARAAGVQFTLNSGHRTLAEQTALFRQNMVRPGVPRPGRPMTAIPQPTAPHIRTGRHAHALDINALDGGEARLELWLRNKGANWRNTVAGEAWHGELSGRALKRLAKKLQPLPKQPRRKPARDRTISNRGVALIASFEGFRGYVYNDAANHATVGYGHLLHFGPFTAEDVRKYGTRQRPFLSLPEARLLLRRDIRKKAADPVRRLVKVPVTQNEFDALVSLVFNIGSFGFAGSTVLRELNLNHRRRAGAAFLLWNRAGGRVLLGLSRRRRAERALFRKGAV